MESNTNFENPFDGRKSKEVWRELKENSIPRNKEEFIREMHSYIEKEKNIQLNPK